MLLVTDRTLLVVLLPWPVTWPAVPSAAVLLVDTMKPLITLPERIGVSMLFWTLVTASEPVVETGAALPGVTKPETLPSNAFPIARVEMVFPATDAVALLKDVAPRFMREANSSGVVALFKVKTPPAAANGSAGAPARVKPGPASASAAVTWPAVRLEAVMLVVLFTWVFATR